MSKYHGKKIVHPSFSVERFTTVQKPRLGGTWFYKSQHNKQNKTKTNLMY